MELKSAKQFRVMMDICFHKYPELYIKFLGIDRDLTEFHHNLWSLPFYQKLVQSSKGINRTKYLYLSDRNCSQSSLFFIYELTYTKFSLKGTYNIEKKIIDIVDEPNKFRESLATIFDTEMANNVPSAIWNYTTLL